MVEGLTRPLLLQPTSRAESWNDDRAAMCRVDIGTGVSRPQPIFNRDGTKCIVFFGECFDYDTQRRELMQRGHTFAEGDDDAEFCLKLYEEHGDGAFSTLDGSFCFAILDSSKGEAILVSDRMGTRPLFYGLTRDGSLVFATQVSAVLSVPGIDRQLDTSAVIEFCCLQRVVGTKTYHKGVRMLAPASALR
jgi:asparagine synthase (glutamine-hydrolysing)